MYYVITNGDKLLGGSPVAYTPAKLQKLADDNNVGVYVISGEHTGQTANPQTEFDSLRIVHVESSTIWAITYGQDGWRSLYRCQVGQPFEVVGDNHCGFPGDVPMCVQDAMWGKGQ